MRTPSSIVSVATALLGVLSLGPAGQVTAQDVLIQGRGYGIEAPRWVRQALAQDPNSFEFRRAWKQKVQRIRTRRGRMEAQGFRPSATELNAGGGSLTGSLQVPVIAGLYSDAGATFQQTEYNDRLFGTGSGAVSVKNLYLEMSGGVFAIDGQVTPWLSLPRPASSYEPEAGTGDKVGRVDLFVAESLDAADGNVDFSQFDNDGPDGIPNSGDDDGFVDVVAFIYESVAMACGGPGIWPHRWNFFDLWEAFNGTGTWYETDDPAAAGSFIKVGDYIIQAGLACDGVSMMGTGTMAHELGHALDLPDLYDTDPYDGSDSEGLGHWALMASGNWNSQLSPAHMSAWSKDFLGWLDVLTLTESETGIQLDPILGSGTAIRVDIPYSNEHFLLSNRQPTGSDIYLPGHGLLITHIDRDLAVGLSENPANDVNADVAHKGVDLEEADGLDHLDFGNNRGDAGDPYPGPAGNTEFHDRTYPGSRAYAESTCQVRVTNILEAAPVVFFDLAITGRTALWGDVDGNEAVEFNDLAPLYFFQLGYRDPRIRPFIDNGDVDGDGDVDLRDGFILHSSFDSIAPPESRTGQLTNLPCAPPPPPFSAPDAGVEVRAKKKRRH